MSDKELTVSLSKDANLSIVVLSGPVDSANVDLFKERIGQACSGKGTNVLLDCRNLTYINSRAIGILMTYRRQLMISFGVMALCELNSKLVRTFDLLHLGESLPIYATREEAIKALKG